MGGSSAWSYLTTYYPWDTGSSVGEGHMMAAVEARGLWQRTAAKCHMGQEYTIRSPKLLHSPSMGSVPRTGSRSPRYPMEACCPADLYSCYWSSSSSSCGPPVDPSSFLESKVDQQWQVSPKIKGHDVWIGQEDAEEGLTMHDHSLSSKPSSLQSLAAKKSRPSMNGHLALTGRRSHYNPGDLDFEWQLILEAGHKLEDRHSTAPSASNDIGIGNLKKENVEVVARNEAPTRQGIIMCENMNHEVLPRSDQGWESHPGSDQDKEQQQQQSTLHFGTISELQDLSSRSATKTASIDVKQAVDAEGLAQVVALPKIGGFPRHWDMSSTSRSSSKGSPHWAEANNNGSHGLLPQQPEVYEGEDCNFPFSQARRVSNVGLRISERLEIDRDEQKLKANSFYHDRWASQSLRTEPTCLVNMSLCSSSSILSNSDPTPEPSAPDHVYIGKATAALESTSGRCGYHSFGMDSNSSNPDRRGEDGAIKARLPGSDVLGEALCRSQTRAREAERKAQRASEERERLFCMYYKEATLACIYRRWVLSLQTENMELRVRFHRDRGPAAWLHQSVFGLSPFPALKRLSYRHWKSFGQDFLSRGHVHLSDHHQQFPAMWNGSGKWKHVSVRDPDDIMVGYTLAFALGLSLAGASLMVGWRMGWILLVY